MRDNTRDRVKLTLRYPPSSELTRVINAARDSGINVTSVETRSDGTIRISDNGKQGGVSDAGAEFDRWSQAGLL